MYCKRICKSAGLPIWKNIPRGNRVWNICLTEEFDITDIRHRHAGKPVEVTLIVHSHSRSAMYDEPEHCKSKNQGKNSSKDRNEYHHEVGKCKLPSYVHLSFSIFILA